MVIKQKIGNLSSFNVGERDIDNIRLEWHETKKRILHKKTVRQKEIVIKFLNEPTGLNEGDILFVDDTTAIVVEIEPCEVIVIKPFSMEEMGAVCYEIGNKHLPLFYDKDELLVPFEAPLFRLLAASGYEPVKEVRKLVKQMKTTVAPHSTSSGKQTLFSKIMQLSKTAADE
jgi:urease accessory protein